MKQTKGYPDPSYLTKTEGPLAYSTTWFYVGLMNQWNFLAILVLMIFLTGWRKLPGRSNKQTVTAAGDEFSNRGLNLWRGYCILTSWLY